MHTVQPKARAQHDRLPAPNTQQQGNKKLAADAQTRGVLEAGFGHDFSSMQLHPADAAVQSVQVAQQKEEVQRDEVEMSPMTVEGYRPGGLEKNVGGLNALNNQGVDPNGIQVKHGEGSVNRNSPSPQQQLPFTEQGWNGDEILSKLGQYDAMAGTDSDSLRCVQAVAMASRIPSGPNAVVSYLSSISFDGVLGRELRERERVALRVIRYVSSRISSESATYGDLSWAQEAIHDLFYNDVSGTVESQINKQLSPTLDGMVRNTTQLNIWCNSPLEIMNHVKQLAPGAQLFISHWRVLLNNTFDDLEEQGIQTRNRMRVQVNGRSVWIKRIPQNQRPKHQDLDLNRDSRSGHQLLILRDNSANKKFSLYEPEITESGLHLQSLSESGAELQSFFKDDPSLGMYFFVHILSRVTPFPPSSFALPSQ